MRSLRQRLDCVVSHSDGAGGLSVCLSLMRSEKFLKECARCIVSALSDATFWGLSGCTNCKRMRVGAKDLLGRASSWLSNWSGPSGWLADYLTGWLAC